MQNEKSEQVIAVTGMRTILPVRIFLADQTCFLKVLDGSPCGFLRDAEILGHPFYAGPSFTHDIPAVIEIDVDELRTVGKLVISIQLFEEGHRFTSYTDVRTGVLRLGSSSWSLMVSPPWAL